MSPASSSVRLIHRSQYSVKEEVTIESGAYKGTLVGSSGTVIELKESAGRGWLYTVHTKQGATIKNIAEEDLCPSADEAKGN
ncbi:hypothetical protein FA13DRAFT_1745623 [Coprinellus micaceus]|uniref:Hypervirulence associated protein TUDOR domain-containing protein n=1 Tax=Coprinellus micaceus TaxID=71717 RepID=A0A4Y7SB38_COPMI|nr:hypothetical protein FA13DRAFT_1745623 [Coprinellus micaceus]